MKTFPYKHISVWLLRYSKFLNGTPGEYLLVVILLIVLSLFYTDFSVFSGNSTLFTNQIGDGTAGVTWQMHTDTDLNPAYGYTDNVNYPDGIDLADPSKITSILVSFPLWLLSRIFSSFMATNLLQIMAYTLMGGVTYLFVKKITGKWYIALFALFAATFYPYMLYKSVIHIDNIFSWVFVFELMAMMYAWVNPGWRSAIAVALSIAAGYFTDGYYLLLSSVFAITITCGIVLASLFLRLSKKQWKQYGTTMCLALLFLTFFSVPLFITRMSQGTSIEKSLGRSEASVKYDMNLYASTKLDFLIPPDNPILKDMNWYKELVQKQKSYVHSNNVESSVYIGYIIILLVIVGLTCFLSLLIQKDRIFSTSATDRNYRRTFIVLSFITMVSLPVLLSFMAPEYITVFGIKIKSLSGILTDHVYLWRVLSRFILPLHVLLVIYASFVMYLLVRRLDKPKHGINIAIILTLALTLLCALEYATSANRPIFDLRKMPQVYRYLESRKDISVIAELPLQDDTPNAYYITAQFIHGKKLINDQEPKYNIGQFNPLGTDENPDTIDFVRQRGAQAIINRAKSCSEKEWGDLIYKEKVSGKMDGSDIYNAPLLYFQTGNRWICLYKIKPLDINLDSSYIINPATTTSYNTRFYTTQVKKPDVELKIADARQRKIYNRKAYISITAFSTGKLPYSWEVIQNNKVVSSGEMLADNKVRISALVNTEHNFYVVYKLLNSEMYTPNDIRMMNYISTLQPN